MIKKLISFLILALFIWLIWAFEGRKTTLPAPESFLSTVEEINPSDSLSRTLIGIQPFMILTDYLSEQNFQTKMELYFQEAEEKGWLHKNSLVLLPEYLGTWLVLAGEKREVAEKETLPQGMTLMVGSNFFRFMATLPRTGNVEDKAAAALFRLKSKKMAKIYFETFSHLAQAYQTHIAAGSIILPGAEVIDGTLITDLDKPLENVSFIFGPDGKIIGNPIRKAFPIESEQPFLSASNPSQIPVFPLPFANTALLICADSWYEEAYQSAVSHQAEVILVPSYCTGDDTMEQLWSGYSGYPEPSSVQITDIGKITEKQAWEKYAMPGKIKSTPAQVGMNVFLRGEFWDLGTDGQPLVVYQGKLLPIKKAEKAGIWALNY